MWWVTVPYANPELKHFLKIDRESDSVYEIEHDPNCPTSEYHDAEFAGGGSYEVYECDIGVYVDMWGLEDLPEEEDWTELSSGRYPISLYYSDRGMYEDSEAYLEVEWDE
jgi:hypothetical protein